MELVKTLNLGVRFLLEILALVIFSFWGLHVTNQVVMKIVLGMGIPILVAAIWGIFGSPKAPYALSGFSRVLLEVVILGLAALALFYTGKHFTAYIFGLLVLINLFLIKIWNQ